jgi:DNA-binding transcriptional LysR family regulator
MTVDRLLLMTVFVAVAEEGSFASAARRLSISPPAVTRAIAALEAHLGIRLFNRTTRYVRMTEAGQRYLEDARRVIAAADEADEAAIGLNAEPRGHITVTASVLFGRLYIMSGIVDYMKRYPAMGVSAIFVDRVVNMLEEGIDVAIRIGELPDSSYRAIRVGAIRRVLCASPQYLAEHGMPQSPEEIANHQIILARGLNPLSELKFVKDNQALTVKVKPRLNVSDNDSAVEAAVNGLGITRLLSYQIAPQLKADTLKIILSEYEPKPVPVHIMHSEGRHTSAKIRTFIDLIAEKLRNNPSLN